MIDIRSGTPLANAVRHAQQAMDKDDYQIAAIHYKRALEAVVTEPSLSEVRRLDVQRSIWIEHVGVLSARKHLAESIDRAQEYIAAASKVGDWQAELELRILISEALLAQDDWINSRHWLAPVVNWVRTHRDQIGLLGGRKAHLMRLVGLFASEAGNSSAAQIMLSEASKEFEWLGSRAGQRIVRNDLLQLGLETGSVAPDAILRSEPQSLNEALLCARALRRSAYYDQAAKLLLRWKTPAIEPTLRFFLLHELALLYQILADDSKVEQLLPELEAAAALAVNRAEARKAVKRIRDAWSPETLMSSGGSFASRLQHVRALIETEHINEAESALRQLRPEAWTPRYAAHWSFVAGELELAIGKNKVHGPEKASCGQQALEHLGNAIDLAITCSLPAIYAMTLWFVGHVYERLYGDINTASAYWFCATRVEELIADGLETDRARLMYIAARPTRTDPIVAALAKRTKEDPTWVGSLIVAMEAARGATMLSLVRPTSEAKPRDLPNLDDRAACWGWCEQIWRRLPRNQAIWLLHPAPGQLHYVVIWRDGMLCDTIQGSGRELLADEILNLQNAVDVLELAPQVAQASISQHTGEIAKLLNIEQLVPKLPLQITRLVIIAGDVAGDIPFAALPLDGTSSSLIACYALSYLPCISALAPLACRSACARGERGLAIRPKNTFVHMNRSVQKQLVVLQDEQATIQKLTKKVNEERFPMVRFDCHGNRAKDALDSHLELAPINQEAGHLTVRQFQDLRLSHCGTLILGACETGMSQRVGQDERQGFVRAGMVAGASAVLVAHWKAEDNWAAAVLDRFQRNMRFMPRDMALQHAQLDLVAGRGPDIQMPGGLKSVHPAFWACWALYGDAGLQTNATWPLRMIRYLTARLGSSVWLSKQVAKRLYEQLLGEPRR
jgi:hypothetical protein